MLFPRRIPLIWHLWPLQAALVGMDKAEPESHSYDTIKGSEAYPKKALQTDTPSLPIPFPVLAGEGVEYLGNTTDGVIALSSYRLFINSKEAVFNIPLGLIEQVECRDIFFLHVLCKDARSVRCTFNTNEDCQRWHRRLTAALMLPKKVEELFGFAFYLWCRDEKKEEFHLLQSEHREGWSISDEIKRMGFDMASVWRITEINKDYELCPSYPRHLLVPATITDANLDLVAKYRYSRRLPTVVWRHRHNGMVIARCSQPELGWFGWRNAVDENLIQAIADACASDPGSGIVRKCSSGLNSDIDGADISLVPPNIENGQPHNTATTNQKLLILDARSYAAALANRAKGGGCECPEYYPNCEIQFMSLANIHSIRKSFQALRSLCSSPPDQTSWLSMLEGTKWLQNISGLMKAALLVTNAVDLEQRPVLVHCSDGWDRTPQIVATAELMLDPYYRTFEGFQVLVEREWLDFGHKFADRCGNGPGTDDPNERCPVFLQWLDCLRQLLHQFPCSFEFNQQYLVKLVHHTYSCLFGTFLCNNSMERHDERASQRTFSIWSYLNSFPGRFRNYLYIQNDKVLRPSCHVRDLIFWADVYHPKNFSLFEGHHFEESNLTSLAPNHDVGKEGGSLVKTKSCDNLFQLDHPPERQRRSSDPNITDGMHGFGPTVDGQPNGHAMVERLLNGDCDDDGPEDDGSVAPCAAATEDDEPASSNSCAGTADVSIDGSTDTLVSDGGTAHLDSPRPSMCSSSKDVGADDGQSAALCISLRDSCNKIRVSDDSRVSISVSTSTTDISESCIRLPLLEPVLLRRDHWYSSCASEVVEQAKCYACLNKKWTNGYWGDSMAVTAQPPFSRSSSMGGTGSCVSTPHHSRTPSSGFPATPCDDHSLEGSGIRGSIISTRNIDMDGLITVEDEVQCRLQKIIAAHQAEMDVLTQDLYLARLALCRQACTQNGVKDAAECPDDMVSLADSACSGEHCSLGQESSAASDSWEQVDEKDASTTLWVPDHAVSQCMGCGAEFWLGRRKHHCRQMMPVPSEQLYYPVRVCESCVDTLRSRCRQQVFAFEKMPKPVVTAAST